MKEALKLALEALEAATRCGAGGFEDAKDAIKEALAQPEQEPVAKYIGECSEGSLVQLYEDVKKGADFYTTPPQRKPLTDERLDDIYYCVEGGATALETWRQQARAIEAAHGIK